MRTIGLNGNTGARKFIALIARNASTQTLTLFAMLEFTLEKSPFKW